MDIYTFIGLIGVAGYVAAYTMLQLGFLDGNSVSYSVANVVAASFVLVSLTQDFNLASAMIQVIWIAVGTIGLLLRIMQRRSMTYASAPLAGTRIDAASSPLVRRDAVGVARARLQTEGSPFRSAPEVERARRAAG